MGKFASTRGDLDSLGTSISVKLPNGQAVSSTLHQYDKMSKLYNLAATETGAKESLIRIKYSGKVLTQDQTVSYLGLMNGMVLKAEVITPRTLDFKIKIEKEDEADSETVSVQLMNTATIRHVLQQLTDKGYENYQIYIGNKRVVVSESMLHDLKIGNNTTLTAKLEQTKCKPTAADSTTNSSLLNTVTGNTDDATPDAMPEFSAEGKPVEVVFSFDTTGSMYSVLTKVRADLRDMIDRLISDIANIRIGIIAQGDYCDYSNYVVKVHELSSDAESLKNFAMDVPSTGGGDSPEAYELVLRKAQEMDWSEESAKALVVIGDCEPHPPSMTDQQIYWHTELDVLAGLGVKVYGVQAMNSASAKPFYRELADRTNGAYVTFSNFSLIKDMFLAVCYNEASEEQLDDFKNELEAQGTLTAQQEDIFTQLREQQQAVKEDKAADICELQIAFDPRQSRNYVATAWFDKSLDKGALQYSLNVKKNKWGPFRGPKNPDSEILMTEVIVKTSSKYTTRKRFSFLNCFA